MRTPLSKIRSMLQNGCDNLLESIFRHYFGVKLIPVVSEDGSAVFYSTTKGRFLVGDYKYDDGCLSVVVENLRPLSVENDIAGKSKKLLSSLFEINEDGRESFQKSLEQLKEQIAKNGIFVSEDVFIDRMKDLVRNKILKYLESTDRPLASGHGKSGVPGPDTDDMIKKIGGGYSFKDNQSGDIEKSNLPDFSSKAWKDISKLVGDVDMEKFYDAFDASNVKFSYADGEQLFGRMEIKLPKNRIWLRENKEELVVKFPSIKFDADLKKYGSAVDDVAKMLRGKKYVEVDEADPSFGERVSEFLGMLSKKEKNGKNMWKWQPFKNDLEKAIKGEIKAIDLVEKYEVLSFLTRDEMRDFIGKSILSITEDPNLFSRSDRLAEKLYDFITENIRGKVYSEILGTKVVGNPSGMLNDVVSIPSVNEAIHDYRAPDDEVMLFVSRLIDTISDLITRYRETDKDNSDIAGVSELLARLNDIWARQRVTDDDRDFLEKVAEKIRDIESNDEKSRSEYMNDKEKRAKGFFDYEEKIFDINAKSVGKNSVETEKSSRSSKGDVV